jgi:flagellar hook-length control protein FliK
MKVRDQQVSSTAVNNAISSNNGFETQLSLGESSFIDLLSQSFSAVPAAEPAANKPAALNATSSIKPVVQKKDSHPCQQQNVASSASQDSSSKPQSSTPVQESHSGVQHPAHKVQKSKLAKQEQPEDPKEVAAATNQIQVVSHATTSTPFSEEKKPVNTTLTDSTALTGSTTLKDAVSPLSSDQDSKSAPNNEVITPLSQQTSNAESLAEPESTSTLSTKDDGEKLLQSLQADYQDILSNNLSNDQAKSDVHTHAFAMQTPQMGTHTVSLSNDSVMGTENVSPMTHEALNWQPEHVEQLLQHAANQNFDPKHSSASAEADTVPVNALSNPNISAQQFSSGASFQQGSFSEEAKLQVPTTATSSIANATASNAFQQAIQNVKDGLQKLPDKNATALVQTPVEDANWGEDIFKHVVSMGTQNLKSMTLQLNPEHMGNIQVHVKLSDGNQASVQFHSEHAQVREALTDALPRLRELLQDNGLQLSNAQINGGNTGSQRQNFGSDQQEAPTRAAYRHHETEDQGNLLTDPSMAPILQGQNNTRGGVDYFA